MQLTEEQKKWLDVLRLKGTARQGQKDNSLLPSNPVRRSGLQLFYPSVSHFTLQYQALWL